MLWTCVGSFSLTAFFMARLTLREVTSNISASRPQSFCKVPDSDGIDFSAISGS